MSRIRRAAPVLIGAVLLALLIRFCMPVLIENQKNAERCEQAGGMWRSYKCLATIELDNNATP